MHAAVGVAACVVGGGCGLLTSPDPDVRVSISAAHFDAEEDLRFEIRNDLDVPIRFSTCADGRTRMGVRRRTGGQWQGVVGDACETEIGPPSHLQPGERRKDSRRGELEEGLYVLFFAYFEVYGPGDLRARTRQSEPFHVTE